MDVSECDQKKPLRFIIWTTVELYTVKFLFP
jgi:hypothetical protein